MTGHARAGKSPATLLQNNIIFGNSIFSPKNTWAAVFGKSALRNKTFAFIPQPDVTLNLQHDWQGSFKEVK